MQSLRLINATLCSAYVGDIVGHEAQAPEADLQTAQPFSARPWHARETGHLEGHADLACGGVHCSRVGLGEEAQPALQRRLAVLARLKVRDDDRLCEGTI
jgi:hypothetical protein